MKLSTKSRYGARMILDLAEHYNEGPVQISKIAKRQEISVKYLEQLIIPLKIAGYIKSVRGPKGGYMLAKPPEEVTIGEIVMVLEGGIDLTNCINDPDVCERTSDCLTRQVWKEATETVYDKLNSINLADMMERGKKIGLPKEEKDVF